MSPILNRRLTFFSILMSLIFCSAAASNRPGAPSGQVYQDYLKFFEEVYQTMDANYYQPVTREAFNRFIDRFNLKIYRELSNQKATINFIKWRSAAYLVDFLKDPEDNFSAFMPPKAAEKFEQKVLGHKIDLGIEGEMTDEGFEVSMVEPRSDAGLKGLVVKDVILKIDRDSVFKMTKEEVQKRLTAEINTKVLLHYFASADKTLKDIEVVSQDYFKQTVFLVPTHYPSIYCLQIKSFNQKTSEDMFRFLSYVQKQGETSLILDLRGNPGGPPLAAREISGFFLPPREEFAYFQKRGKPKSLLDVPPIPEQYHYQGDIVILVDEGSGSASELFSGILQNRKRAVLMGTNTAGKVLLKSMYYFSDNSMVALVTARGYYPDGTVFSYQGLDPDFSVEKPEGDILIRKAAEYLMDLRKKVSP